MCFIPPLEANGGAPSQPPPTRRKRLRHVSGRRVLSGYDDLGRKIREIDARGNATRYEYDNAGNLTAVVDRSGARTAYEYDAVGNLTSEVDARGNVTAYTYDANNRLTREEKPLGLITTYAYDPAGQLRSKTVAGEVTTYGYDLLGRVTSITPQVGPARTFTYDIAGKGAKIVYMAGAKTTTIRVTRATRDELAVDARRHGMSISAYVDQLARESRREAAFAAERESSRREASDAAVLREQGEWEALGADALD